MRTFMAAIVGLVIIVSAAWAQDKKPEGTPAKDSQGGATGSHEGKVVAVAPDASFVIITDKKGKQHKMHIGADTKVTADGKTVEGGAKNLKAGNTVTISWEMDTHGNRVGTHIRIVDSAHD